MGFMDKLKSAAAMPSDANTLNASGQEMRRLMAEGTPGKAVIREARDTGERLAGNTVLDLDLTVTLDGGAPYETTLRMPIAGSDTGPYATGSEYNVRVDPADRDKLTFSA